MRILHAVVSDSFAGVERYVVRLARAQSAQGHAVHVAGGEPDAVARELAGSGVTHARASDVPRLVRELRRYAASTDVVHVHMTAAEVSATLALTPVPRQGRPAVVSTRHFARTRGHGPSGALVAAVARRPIDAQIAIREYVARAVDGEASVVHTGVDDVPDPPPSATRERVVLLAQRLEPEKRSNVALVGFARSGLAGSGWRLDVAGDGAQRAELEQLAHTLEVAEQVRFLGRRDDVPALMRRSGLLVAPCPVEGLGLSVLEAMAAGLPVVAAEAGGHLEILAGVDDACLTAAGDAEAVGRSLGTLGHDRVLRDAVAQRALTRQRSRFTLAAQLAGTMAVYDAVVGEQTRRQVGSAGVRR